MRMFLEVLISTLATCSALTLAHVVKISELRAASVYIFMAFTAAMAGVGLVRWIKAQWDAQVVKNIETTARNAEVQASQDERDKNDAYDLLIAFAESNGGYQMSRQRRPHRLISAEHGEWLPPTALTAIDKKQ